MPPAEAAGAFADAARVAALDRDADPILVSAARAAEAIRVSLHRGDRKAMRALERAAFKVIGQLGGTTPPLPPSRALNRKEVVDHLVEIAQLCVAQPRTGAASAAGKILASAIARGFPHLLGTPMSPEASRRYTQAQKDIEQGFSEMAEQAGDLGKIAPDRLLVRGLKAFGVANTEAWRWLAHKRQKHDSSHKRQKHDS